MPAPGETVDSRIFTPYTKSAIPNQTGTVGQTVSLNCSYYIAGSTGTWSDGGTLPDGLSIDPNTGVITGTPTTAGPFTVEITVSNL